MQSRHCLRCVCIYQAKNRFNYRRKASAQQADETNRMGKRIIFCLFLMCLSLSFSLAETNILTTFYPMYILTQNVALDIEGVTVTNMAEQTVGCLHDYTLQTQDMVALEQADILVINGGGIEQFMERALAVQPDLPVVDASLGIEMEPSVEEGLLNAHVWMDPVLAEVQVKNIAGGLAAADPTHAEQYAANAEAYCSRLSELDQELKAELAPLAGMNIITFHEAFNYFARRYGMNVAGVIATEPGEEPSTREIADTCDLVLDLGIRTLFVEPQYPKTAAEVIARETGASLYTLDPCVSGDGTPGNYEAIQRQNAEVLKEAFGL